MKSKMIKITGLILTVLFACFTTYQVAAADTWQYGDLTKLIASSNGGGTKYDTYRQVGLSIDDKNVYMYVSMDPELYASDDATWNTGDRNVQLTGYVLTIAGQPIYIDSKSYDFYNLQSSQQNQTKSFPVDVYNPSTFKNTTVTDAVTVQHLVRDNGNRVNNIMQFTIPISALGLKDGEISENAQVTLTNNNIWSDAKTITYAGASTAPWPLVVLGLLIALISVIKMRKSKGSKTAPEVMQYA